MKLTGISEKVFLDRYSLKSKEGKSIEMYGDGETARDYTYVADIVDGIYCALNYLIQNDKVFEKISEEHEFRYIKKKGRKDLLTILNDLKKENGF